MSTASRNHIYLTLVLLTSLVSNSGVSAQVSDIPSTSEALDKAMTTFSDIRSRLQAPKLAGNLCSVANSDPQEKTISDDLVQNLPCAGLDEKNVLRFIPKEKLIAKADLIGSVQTNFSAPGMRGQCWAITRAQRIAIYLTTVTPKAPAGNAHEAMNELRELAKTRETFLNMSRGSILDRDCNAYFVTADTPCDIAQKSERPMPLSMINLPTQKSIQDLMKLSRRRMPSNADWIDPDHLSKTDWLARNGQYFPKLAKKLKIEETIKEADEHEYDLTFARLAQEFSKIDLAVLSGSLSNEAIKQRKQALINEAIQRMNRSSQKTRDSLEGNSKREKLESEIPNVPTALETGERLLASDLAQAQLKLFFRPRNVRFLGGGRERSAQTNAETASEVAAAIDNGRMPMLNLRFKLAAQHVVTAFSHKKLADGTIEFEVFDSNSEYPEDQKAVIDHDGERVMVTKRTGEPPRRMKLHYKDGAFTYPDEKAVAKFGREPIGVFVTDESEMDEIQKIVFEHYRGLCQSK